MTSKRHQIVTAMIALLLVGAVAPGFAAATDGSLAVDATQNDTDVTVTVTHNDTAVENATVAVTALNNSSYAGDGTYTTDANGTVALSAPSENVTVEVTAEKDNATGSATVDLVAVEQDEEPEFENFGQRVSWFVHSLLGDEDTEGGIGQAVSDFVTSNNPSNDNKPDHAEKPDQAGNDKGNDADSQNKSNGGGPPDHANNDKGDDTDEDENVETEDGDE